MRNAQNLGLVSQAAAAGGADVTNTEEMETEVVKQVEQMFIV